MRVLKNIRLCPFRRLGRSFADKFKFPRLTGLGQLYIRSKKCLQPLLDQIYVPLRCRHFFYCNSFNAMVWA